MIATTIRIAAVLLCIAGSQARLLAWGCEGHQAIAIMAEMLMSPEAVKAANELLTSHPGPHLPRRFCDISGISPMADASTWADDYREAEPSTSPIHFINIPIVLHDVPDVKEFCQQGCVVNAIRDNLARLKTSKSDEERAMALRLLIHLVGDVHQPLHASTNNDLGGNCVPVRYFSDEPTISGPTESAHPNLHSVWDSLLVRRFIQSHDYAVEDVADHLRNQYRRRLQRWAAVQDPAAWAVDSFERSRTVVYGALPASIRPEPAQPVRSCADDNHVSQRMLALKEQIDDTYLDSAIPVLKVQLAKAAARLARMLEDALHGS